MADKKLYRCEVNVVIYVLADDEQDAQTVAADNLHEETCLWGGEKFAVYPECDARGVNGWMDCIPYGENPDNLTVRQILRKMDEAPATDAPTPGAE